MTERLLTKKETCAMTGQKHAQMYRLIKLGKFPKPVKISERRVAWKLSDIQEWISTLGYSDMEVNPNIIGVAA